MFMAIGRKGSWPAGSTSTIQFLTTRRFRRTGSIGFANCAVSSSASSSVCQDKTGADESVRLARDWINKNAANTGAAAPTALLPLRVLGPTPFADAASLADPENQD
jgi:hypothetical protein